MKCSGGGSCRGIGRESRCGVFSCIDCVLRCLVIVFKCMDFKKINNKKYINVNINILCFE